MQEHERTAYFATGFSYFVTYYEEFLFAQKIPALYDRTPGSAYGTRTRAPALRGPCPDRLDERAMAGPQIYRLNA
jgi:hypothetical protein